MVVHNVTIGLQGASAATVAAELVRVTRPEELPAALKQRAKPVVIENSELEHRFSRLEFWQGREGTWLHRYAHFSPPGLGHGVAVRHRFQLAARLEAGPSRRQDNAYSPQMIEKKPVPSSTRALHDRKGF
jgi:hypothetical protein